MIDFLASSVQSVVFFICPSAKSEILLQSFFERNFRLDRSFWFIIQFGHRIAVVRGKIRFLGWLSPPVLRSYLLFKEDKHRNKIRKQREKRSVAFPVVYLGRCFSGMFFTNQAFGKHAVLFACFTLLFSMGS